MDHSILLQEYSEGFNLLSKKIEGLPDKLLLFRPPIVDAWSIKEHVIHIVDCEINNFIRWRSILAQPKSTCFVIEENKWTENLNYQKEDISKYLQVFKILRMITNEYLADIDEKLWSKDYFMHEYQGQMKNVTLKECINIYKNHVPWHIEYIDRNIKLWKN